MRITALFLLTVLTATAVSAQRSEGTADDLVSALARCRALADVPRLTCFDQATARLLAATEQRQIKVVDRETVRQTKRALFGFSLPHIDFFGSAKADGRGETETDVHEITGKIIQVRPASNGLWTFGVENSGVWQSLQQSIAFMPQSGDTITIRGGLLGHYSAKIGKERPVDVKRIR